jgi:hypothetical protein
MLIHTDYDAAGLKGMRNRTTVAVAPVAPPTDLVSDDTDPELAAYNRRLAALSEQGPKTWRSPERTVVRTEGSK